MELRVQLYLSVEHSALYSFIVPVTPVDLQGMERFCQASHLGGTFEFLVCSKSLHTNVNYIRLSQVWDFTVWLST